MSAARLLILVIAAVAAIALAFVVRGAFAPKKAPVAAAAAAPTAKPTVRVLVAKRDLPIGTRLTAADLGWQDWPAEGLSPTFTTDGAPPRSRSSSPCTTRRPCSARRSGRCTTTSRTAPGSTRST